MADKPHSPLITTQRKQEAHIGNFQHAPEYMQDNDHITHGYRINFNTPKKIIKSLFMVHNESVNIWTHLLAALTIIGIIIYVALVVFANPQIARQQISQRKENIGNSFDNYIKGLQNITDLPRSQNLQQMKAALFQSYQTLTNQISKSTQNMQNALSQKYSGIKDEMSKKFKNNLEEFEKHKRQFQKVFLPFLFNQMATRLNSTYLNQFKTKMLQIKNQIDSDSYFANFVGNLTPNPHSVSKWPIFVFLSSAFICLMCSTIFHLFYPMSKRSYVVFSRFDYAGVNMLISGSGFPILYYTMYCNFDVAIMYLSITMIGGASLFLFSLAEWFHRPKYVKFRGWSYALYGLHFIFPILHLCIDIMFFNKDGDPFEFITTLPYLLLAGASYLIGVSIYVKRCPQRKYPGQFNVCGHSHQIWHCFVILGIIFTYLAVMTSFEMRKISACPINNSL